MIKKSGVNSLLELAWPFGIGWTLAVAIGVLELLQADLLIY